MRRSLHFGPEDRFFREIVVLSPSESAHRTCGRFGVGPSPRPSPGGRGSLSHFACRRLRPLGSAFLAGEGEARASALRARSPVHGLPLTPFVRRGGSIRRNRRHGLSNVAR